MVLDNHGAVVVDGWVAGDDADDGRGYFFPGVQFFSTRNGPELEEPGSEGVDVEGLAVEFGLYGGFAIVIPFCGLGPGCANRWMMADLFDEEAIAFIWSDIFVGLAQEGIERLSNAADGRCILTGCKCGHVNHTFGRVGPVCCRVKQISIFHIFSYTLQ